MLKVKLAAVDMRSVTIDLRRIGHERRLAAPNSNVTHDVDRYGR